MGEHAVRFSPDGADFVDVCPLCQDVALDHGWVREGGADLAGARRSRRAGAAPAAGQSLLGVPREPEDAARRAREPILRRLSDDEIALVEAAELFNASLFRRTDRGGREGARRAARLDHAALRREQRARAHVRLGHHLVPVPRLARVGPAVRLAERGADISEIEAAFTNWNASVDEDGRVVPNVARV